MHRRKFLSAILIMPLVAKAIADNGAAGEEGSPSLRDIEWEAHKKIAKDGFKGFKVGGKGGFYLEEAGPMRKIGLFSDENGNPIYMKDENIIPHTFKGDYIEHEVYPFGKVKVRKYQHIEDQNIENEHIIGKQVKHIAFPDAKEVPTHISDIQWKLFDYNGTIAKLK